MKKILIKILSRIFNAYFDRYTGGSNRPVFFDIDKTQPTLRVLDKHADIIRYELQGLLTTSHLRPYHEIDKLQYNISAVNNPEKSWKVYMLYMMGEFSEHALQHCPRTCGFLHQIPGIYQSFFSILEARKSIPPHNGSYRGYLRYHIGISVPQDDPPVMRVKDQHYSWRNDESVLFDDSWNHEVINHCEQDRIILVADVYRPMPAAPAAVNRWVTKNLIKRFYAEKILKKLKD